MEKDIAILAKLAAALLAGLWGGLEPLVQILIGFMVLDIATGVLAGIVTKSLSSDISFKGMAKKGIILLLAVGIPRLLEPNINLPIGEAIAGFYCANELLSIIENAGKAGLPIPTVLKEVLSKLSPEAPKPRG